MMNQENMEASDAVLLDPVSWSSQKYWPKLNRETVIGVAPVTFWHIDLV